MLSILTDPLLTLLYPKFCGACSRSVENRSNGSACDDCWASTRIFGIDDPLCPKCGNLLAGVAAAAIRTCKQCDDHEYDLAVAGGLYEKALAATVVSLKHTPDVPRVARNCLIDAFDRIKTPAELTVVPVPLSRQRLLERGFNQAALLARVIAKHSRHPLDEHSLIRKQDTPIHRAAMDRKAREATVRKAFAVVRPNLIRGKNILLVDDLMTSGSTVSHCAKVLKKSGAAKVTVLTLARAV